MSNKLRTTFYIGVTSDLPERVHQHREGNGCTFTRKYRCFDLIYYECFESIGDAIDREKKIKNWHRQWKIRLIKTLNPRMDDLSEKLIELLY